MPDHVGGISYGGISLLYETDEVNQWMHRYQRPEELFHLAPPHRTPSINYPRHPHLDEGPVINSLYWPTGASRWGSFYGLASAHAVLTIREVARVNNGYADLVIGGLTFKYMYLLPPRPIAAPMAVVDPIPGRLPGFVSDLWLIPLVDMRYSWQYVHSGDFAVTSGMSWTTFFGNLTARLTTVPIWSIAPAHADFLGPGQELSQWHHEVPAMLDAGAHAVGMRVILQADGNARIDSPVDGIKTTEDWYQENIDILKLPKSSPAGGYIADVELVPANVTVSYPALRDGCEPLETPDQESPGERHEVDVALVDVDNAGSLLEFGKLLVELNNADLKKIVRSSAAATFEGAASTPTNATELSNNATQIATRYYYYLGRQYDVTWNGLIAWEPEGYDDCVIWNAGRYRGLGEDLEYSTRVQTQAENLSVDEIQQESTTEAPETGLKLYRFTLNEDMGATTANLAEGDVLEMDGTDTTVDASIRDPVGIFASLLNGARGLALAQCGRYYVIQSICPSG